MACLCVSSWVCACACVPPPPAGELDRLRLECSALQEESAALRAEKVTLLERLQQLELQLDR